MLMLYVGVVEGGLTHTEHPLASTRNFSEHILLLFQSLILKRELSPCPTLEY